MAVASGFITLIELVLKAFPIEGPSVFQSLLPKIIKSILNGEENCIVLSMHLSLFARILLHNQQYIWSVIQHVASESGNDTDSIFEALLEIWTEKLDVITQPERRKLSALALASLLSQNHSIVTHHFGIILNALLEVLHDICRVDEDGTMTDSLLIDAGEAVDDNQDTQHDKRKYLLARQDPVHTVCLRSYFVSQLNLCQQIYGQEPFDQLMKSVDSEIVAQLQPFYH